MSSARCYVKRSRRELIRLARHVGDGCLRIARRSLEAGKLDQYYAALRSAREEYALAARLHLDGYFVLGGHRR